MTDDRSPVIQVAVLVASPLALAVAAYLLFAGHNQPGGGFAAGLVVGAVIALRTMTGISVPVDAWKLVSLGGVIAAVTMLLPVVTGGVLLDQVVVETTLPVLGKVKSGSALPFDIGVAFIVVGLVVAVLDSFGVVALAQPVNRDGDETLEQGSGER